MQTISQRRVLGSFYTPEWIARWMVSRALGALSNSFASDSSLVRILDPACGDGAFVLTALDWIAEKRGVTATDESGRLDLVRRHLFGVDADSQAITVLHQRVADWVGSRSSNTGQVASVLRTNFRHGDALLGSDWAAGDHGHELPLVVNSFPTEESGARPIDWWKAFPEVAVEGGFDVVIGNPPYRRELNAKSDFDKIAASTLGKRWRTARMDLWHYFLHRGLDLLKRGGRLSFIVNSYWIRSTAAKLMRERLAAETSLEEIVHFGTARLFRDVSGRHMIFQLSKQTDSERNCNVLDLVDVPVAQIEAVLKDSCEDSPSGLNSTNSPTWSAFEVPQSHLWTAGRLESVPNSFKDDWPSTGVTLGDVFDVRQGMAENPPFVTKGAAAELGDPDLAGKGVFVLTVDEVAALGLNGHEQSLLRPYYVLSSIDRFHVPFQPTHQVLYLTRITAPSLEALPGIARHLERFRMILERRREVQNGKQQWWHLHWPREERLFTLPRALCIQMGHIPRFAYAEHPTYVGFSLHVIVARPPISIGGDPAAIAPSESVTSLPAVTGLLNSSRGKRWFAAHAKRRGAHLDISGMILKKFPLPRRVTPAWQSEMDLLVRNWPFPGNDLNLAESLLDELTEQCFAD